MREETDKVLLIYLCTDLGERKDIGTHATLVKKNIAVFVHAYPLDGGISAFCMGVIGDLYKSVFVKFKDG